MIVNDCPICGRKPKIEECVSRTGIRRRMCGCPNLCGVVPAPKEHIYKSWFIYLGDGDDNAIFKLWNLATNRYASGTGMPWCERDWSKWTDDEHLEKHGGF